MRFRAGTVALALGVLAGCKDCGGKDEPTTTADAAAAPAVATSARPRLPMVRASGVTGMLFRSLREMDLKDEQRAAIEKIAGDLRDATKDAGPPENAEAQSELAAGIKAGKLDTAKLEAHYAAIERAAKAREAREDEALNRLHQTLDAAQRTAAVAAVKESLAKRAERDKRREDAGAVASHDRYTRRLDLDPEQKRKVDAFAPKVDRAAAHREQTKKYNEALLEAFEKDGFDAKTIESGASKHARATQEEHMKFLGQILGVLKPDQRDRLSKQLTAHGGGGHDRARYPFHGGEDEEE